MNTLEQITVPNVVLLNNDSLSWSNMVGDTVKATKSHCDPVSECAGTVLGCLCCVATAVVQAEGNSKKKATRFDVVNAPNIRARERAERGGAYECGYCLGDILVDTGSILLGGLIGFIRATANVVRGNTSRSDKILGLSREDVDQVELFDSCKCCTSCLE